MEEEKENQRESCMDERGAGGGGGDRGRGKSGLKIDRNRERGEDTQSENVEQSHLSETPKTRPISVLWESKEQKTKALQGRTGLASHLDIEYSIKKELM